ncbi:MAG: hypothetical protein ACYDEX_19170 [Mobilitalea sp.]
MKARIIASLMLIEGIVFTLCVFMGLWEIRISSIDWFYTKLVVTDMIAFMITGFVGLAWNLDMFIKEEE